jgi:hypothetical protein
MLAIICLWLAFIISVAAGKSTLQVREILTIAGNFSLNGKFTNMAQYDINTGEWSNSHEPELYVYGESNGALQLYLFFIVIRFVSLTVLSWANILHRRALGYESEPIFTLWPQWQCCRRVACGGCFRHRVQDFPGERIFHVELDSDRSFTIYTGNSLTPIYGGV